MLFYELWDKKSRNLLGSYRTKQEALALAARVVAADPRTINRLALEWGDDEDEDAGGVLSEEAELGNLLDVPSRSRVGSPRLAPN